MTNDKTEIKNQLKFNNIKITKVWFDNEYIYIQTNIGHIAGNPLEWFPELAKATQEQRNNFEISDIGIHWPELDEDLSLEGFFDYKKELLYPKN